MASRRRDNDLIGLAAQLAGLVALLSLISPQVRQMISAVGFIAICLVALSVLGLIGFGVYRLATRNHRQETETVGYNSNWQVTPPTASKQQAKPRDEIINQLRSIDWFQFEKVVALVYRKLGYSVTRRGGANPDGGIDLIIEKDGQSTAVQCKQWKTWKVGVRAIREFLGALKDSGIEKGILITLCGYTGEAKRLADKHQIEIVNEVGLVQMIASTDAKFDPETLSILRDDRKFCPKCESEMVLRTAKKGLGVGKQFWGCSAYPRCRFTINSPA